MDFESATELSALFSKDFDYASYLFQFQVARWLSGVRAQTVFDMHTSALRVPAFSGI